MKWYVYFLLLSSLLLVSCENIENSITNPASAGDVKQALYLPPTPHYNYYFAPVAGKEIAITIGTTYLDKDPVGNHRWWDTLKTIRSKYGISRVFIYSDSTCAGPYDLYWQMRSAGFSTSQITYCIIPKYLPYYGTDANIQARIDYMLSQGVTNFYIDEPLERQKRYEDGVEDNNSRATYTEVVNWANYINTQNTNAKLFLGTFTDFVWNSNHTNTIDTIAHAYYNIIQQYGNVYMMHDDYAASNQDSVWARYRNNYKYNGQYRSISNFIDDSLDINEWGTHFVTANNLNLQSICYYVGNSGWWGAFQDFCDAAAQHGWLDRGNPAP